jgi:8-oxo-dGTP pyrophosphatase MutT (NUDIX family)
MQTTFYRVAYRLLRLYWFLFRPRTYGARCILVCEDHVLLIRQTYGDRLWTLPGGGLTKGETPEAAVRREVKEEVGVSLSRLQYLGQFVSTQTYNVDTVYVFTAPAPNQAYTLDAGEILAARWFAREALPPVSAKTRTALGMWQQHENTGAEAPVLQGANSPS